jgi:diphthamide biosynthesis methyltransferase
VKAVRAYIAERKQQLSLHQSLALLLARHWSRERQPLLSTASGVVYVRSGCAAAV